MVAFIHNAPVAGAIMLLGSVVEILALLAIAMVGV
jgi:hypothetical protein